MERVKISISISITFLVLLLLPISYLFISPIVRPIKNIAEEARKIKNRQYDQIKPINIRITEIQELNNSMESMYKSIEKYQSNQRELIESLVKLIAQAIDEKSPYTAGHCNRVAELGLMLANAAHDSDLPYFQDFKFHSEEE